MKRLHRFIILEKDLKIESSLELTNEAMLRQWIHVFRLKSEDQVILCDNKGFDFVAEITSLEKNRALLSIIEKRRAVVIEQKVSLAVSIVKKDTFEWIVEKGTEIGVSSFIPLLSDRSEKKNLNFERLQKIATEASEQSGRGIVPIIKDISSFEDFLKNNQTKNPDSIIIAFHPASGNPDNNQHFFNPQEYAKKNTTVLIGPEGGWSEKEVELLLHYSISLYSLGNQVLRAETAAIVVAGLILFSVK